VIIIFIKNKVKNIITYKRMIIDKQRRRE